MTRKPRAHLPCPVEYCRAVAVDGSRYCRRHQDKPRARKALSPVERAAVELAKVVPSEKGCRCSCRAAGRAVAKMLKERTDGR